jgi:TetR/AcrR family transcriptional regulator, regulator of cefoperazone and chloramphenicol sensitivity
MGTKEKIILAAAEEFASIGFHATTTRAICQRAGVNIAAINYHFNSKELLYKHVVDYLFDVTENTDLKPVKVSTQEEIEEAILAWIKLTLINITSSESLFRWKNRILFREMLDPSELLPFFFNDYFKPRLVIIEYYVRLGMPAETAKETVWEVLFSILGQVLFYGQNQSLIAQVFKDEPMNFKKRYNKIAEYIADGVCSRLNFKQGNLT